jgi:hypothetical protein
LNMRKFWIAAMTAGLLTMTAIAQTSANGSASGSASVTPGQTSAGAAADTHGTLTPAAAATVDSSANAQASPSDKKKKDSSSSANASGNSAGAAGVGGASGALSTGTTLQAELSKSLDAKKAKPGDEVSAKLTQDVKENGRVVLHKGSKLVGHVTEAQAKSKENAESKLGVVFDKAVLKGGEEVAFNGVIQAVAPPVQGALSVAGDENSSLGSGMGSGSSMGGGHSGGGGPLGSVTSTTGSTVNSATGAVGNAAGSVTNSTGAVNGAVNRTAGVAANGAITSAAHGVVGMQGVDLNTAAAGSAQGSVISSASRNIKLDSGTQMILQVAGSAAAH